VAAESNGGEQTGPRTAKDTSDIHNVRVTYTRSSRRRIFRITVN